MTEAQKRDLRMKTEIASELGLLEKVESVGWKGLTARETGRIGGIMGRKKIKEREKLKKQDETSCNTHKE
nr:small, acid-soluble spore protein, alpha/beta type [Chakrabartyella piscis]